MFWVYNSITETFDVVDGCQNVTMAELQNAVNNSTLLNYTVSKGQTLDLTYRIDWSWAEYIELPDTFEIRDNEGNKYYFADGMSSSEWYLSVLDTALGTGNFSGTTQDTSGNTWTILSDGNSVDFGFDVVFLAKP